MKMLDAAIEYLEQEFSIVPSNPKTKAPLVPWTEFQSRLATKDEIYGWFRQYPRAMISLVTGKTSGITIVDADSLEAIERINKYLPDSLEIPCVQTPRDGKHFYFSYTKGIPTKAGILPHIDTRNDGGCIVVPPSINGNGKAYSWLDGIKLSRDILHPIPPALASLLCGLKAAPINNSNINNNYQSIYKGCDYLVTNSEKLFEHGRRDNDLFHLALSLRKQNWSPEHILQVLINVAHAWGEGEKIDWLKTKVESACKYEERKEISLVEQIKEWILVTPGHFLVTECHKDLNLVTPSHKHNANVIFSRFVKEGLIERVGEKRGCYRKIDTSEEMIDFLNTPTTDLYSDLKFPLGLENYYRAMPKNEIIVAGCPDSGKTALLLNFVALNMDRYEIYYFSSEMGALELKDRLSNFNIPLDKWRCKFVERSSNFTDVIRPDAVNVIDYMELCTDTFRIGEYLRAIHDKLKTGIAIIALQKPFGRDLGRGAEFSLEKPRLYVSMEKNQMKIIKCKNWRDSQKNPNSLTIDYKLVKGCQFISTSGWKRSD